MSRRAGALLLALAAVAAACTPGVDVGSRAEPVRYRAHVDVASEGAPLPEAFSGTWRLVLEGDRYRLEQDGFGSIAEDFTLEDGKMLIMATPAPAGAFNCYAGGERVVERVTARYEIRAEGDALILEEVEEPCPLRAEILARRWEER